MVGVRVRENDGQQTIATSRAKLGGQDARADVHRAPDEPSSVDHHGLAVRKVDQRAVALPDVEEGGSKNALGRARSPRCHLEQENRRSGGQERAPAAPEDEPREPHEERDELPTSRLRNVDRERRRTEGSRDGSHENEGASGRHRTSSLRGGPPAEQGMRETKRQSGGLARRHRQKVGENAPDGHGRREPRKKWHTRDGGREGGGARVRYPRACSRQAAREPISHRTCEDEKPCRGPGRQDERKIEGGQRLAHGHGHERQAKRARRVAPSCESPRCKRSGGHPGRAFGRPPAAGKIGVQPRDGHPERRDRASDVASRGDRLHAHQHPLERPHDEREDEHQVHSGHGQEVRQATRAKCVVVVRREVGLSEHERPRHGGYRGREGRLDSSSYMGAGSVDPCGEALAGSNDPHVQSASRTKDSPASLSRPRVTPPDAFHSRCGAPSGTTTSASSPRARPSGPP